MIRRSGLGIMRLRVIRKTLSRKTFIQKTSRIG
jgi:hypothetical protein